MACYHPLKAFPVGFTDSGKRKMKVTAYEVKSVYQMAPGSSWYCSSDLFRPPACFDFCSDALVIPCGQCIGCRLEYSRQWANRCMLELQYHDSAYFVTLTYNEEHVPRSYYGDPASGEALPSLTLRKRDCQLFMKRLRKKFSRDKIRFYMCGEYGPTTFRPHYHAILFGLHLNDLVPFSRSEQGFMYYTSQSLQDVWSVIEKQDSATPLANRVPIGHILVANVTWETCAYTARYVTKKLTGPQASFYEDFNIERPFVVMSNKPGIARQYYDDHPDLYDYEYINIKTPTGGRKFRPPKYFDKLFDLDQPEASAALKETRRKMAEQSQKAKLSQTTMSYLELLQVEEHAKLDAIKSLDRGEI